MNCSRTTQESLSYGIIIIVLFYGVMIFCWPEGVACDVAQWLFLANHELLWTSVGLVKVWGWNRPLECLAFLSVPPRFLNTAAVVWGGVLCPDTQRVHCDYYYYYYFLLDCKNSWMGRWPSWWPSSSKVPKVINLLKCLKNKIMAL